MKNYYEILGVEKTAGEDEIRKRYRQLAMEFHPDKNPDNAEAEEKFKEIAEAYGVLTDPVKRKQYDAYMASGKSSNQQGGFFYSQEDILRDLFRDPRFQQMFQGVLREFQRTGLRGSPHFLKKTFFGSKGGFFIGGLFFFGSLAGPKLLKKGQQKVLPQGKSILKTIGSKVAGLLGQVKSEVKSSTSILDVTYRTPVSINDLEEGIWAEVVTTGQVLKVRIPAGSRYGQKLRLKGKGRKGRQGRGDLYLQLCKKN